MKNPFKKILIRTALYYTVLTFVYSLITLIRFSKSEGGAGASAERILLFLPFCFLFAAANVLVLSEGGDPLPKWLLHALLTIGGGFLCLILPLGGKGSQLLIGLMMLIVAYGIAVTIVLITRSRLKKTIERDRELKAAGKR